MVAPAVGTIFRKPAVLQVTLGRIVRIGFSGADVNWKQHPPAQDPEDLRTHHFADENALLCQVL